MKKRKEFTENEWMKKMWYIYTMEDYSAMKRNEIESFIETVIETEVRKTHINTCMQNQEKWYKWTYLQGRNRDTFRE